MKVNKKYILLLIIIFGVIISLILISKNSSKKNDIITPSKPTIKTRIEGNIKFDNTFDKSKYLFPEKLPTITLVKKIMDKDFVEKIKNNIKLKEDIQEFNDSFEGKKFFVNSENKYLIVTPKTGIVKYGLAASEFPIISNKNINDEEFINISKNFITNSGLYNPDQIKLLEIKYLKRNPLTEGFEKCERDEAEVFAVSFNFSSNEFETVNNYSVRAPIYLELLRNGEILNSEVTIIKELKRGITDYPIKNYQEFVNSLGQAKVISLDGDYYSVSDIKSINEVKEILINNVRIAYYDEGKNDSYLQPVFVIDASIEIAGSSSNKAVLYLPAYK